MTSEEPLLVAMTWLLLRMYCVEPDCTNEPNVPVQQKPPPTLPRLLPETPSEIGRLSTAVVLQLLVALASKAPRRSQALTSKANADALADALIVFILRTPE